MIPRPTDLYNCTTCAKIAPTMSRLHLLLASRSPRRRELVGLLGLPFEMTVADVAEDPLANEPPAVTAARLSQAKARAAPATPSRPRPVRLRSAASSCSEPGPGIRSCPNPPTAARLSAAGGRIVVILACDTVVALDGEVLGKPCDASEAIDMLRRLRGRSHTVYSAVTLLELATGRTSTDVAETRLVMRTYTDAEIATYVASGDPLDKAGAYAIQHPGFHPIARYQGCYANVVGLPLCHITRCLRAFRIEPLHDVPAACQAHTGQLCPVYATVLAGQPNQQMANDT
jgi:septum formation protein